MTASTAGTGTAIGRIAIVGGGTAGWVAAAILSHSFRNRVEIVLLEAEDIGSVGVGEATIPPILDLLRVLEIDRDEFVAATGATYKLGIVFDDWMQPGHRYWHPFGGFGASINGRPFHHYWHRARAAGRICRVPDYSMAAALGEAGRFAGPQAAEAGGARHALHFDAALLARYLRRLAEGWGMQRIVGKVAGCTRTAAGLLDELITTDARRINADLFIDCSGFASALLGRELRVRHIDFRHWLPCDRAITVPSAPSSPRPPYTVAAAHGAGWRWQIPLQHRTGNGLIYSSRFMADDVAYNLLRESVPVARHDEMRQLRFETGRREVFWRGNCIALGLASGFLEPLESTSIQLMINGVFRLLDHFPDRSFAPHDIAAYNRAVIGEFDSVRDFIILHYWLAQRRDTPFWMYCADMDVPDSLRERVELYREAGRIVPHSSEMFSDLSWFYVLDGLGGAPTRSDALAALPADRDLFGVMDQLRDRIAGLVRGAPLHDSWFANAAAGVDAEHRALRRV